MSTGNFHEQFRAERPVTSASHRKFGWTFTIVFAGLGIWSWLAKTEFPTALFLVTCFFLAMTLLAARVLTPLQRLWMRLGNLLHKVTNPVLLGLIFFGAVLPTAVIMRIFGKRPLHLKFDNSVPSYWIARNPPGPAPETMKNQF